MSFWSRLTNVLRGDRLIPRSTKSCNHTSKRQPRRVETPSRRGGRSVPRCRGARRAATSGSFPGLIRCARRCLWLASDLEEEGYLGSGRSCLWGWPIGACTSAFRLIDALLLRPLPVAEPERLVLGILRKNRPGRQTGYRG